MSESAPNSEAQRMVSNELELELELELEAHCGEVYLKFIQAGFRHPKEIKNHPDWNVVMVEYVRSLNT